MGMERQQASRAPGCGLRHAWHQRGFRRSILAFSVAALLVFIANLSFAAWATVNLEVREGVGVIAEKSCSETRKLSAGIHVVINALSTILLAGSNYCMQCLSAPTRSQVDEAHRQHRWMDIGVSSLRNALGPYGNHHIGWGRMILWLLLGLSSLPLHLFYNSAVFESRSINTYDVWMMPADWVRTGPFAANLVNNPTVSSITRRRVERLHAAISEGRLQRLDRSACVDAYYAPFQSDRSELVLISGSVRTADNVLGPPPEGFFLPNTAKFELPIGGCGSAHSFQWMCNQYQPRSGPSSWRRKCETPCEQLGEQLRQDASDGKWAPFEERPISHCYSLPSEEHCKLQFSVTLTYTVVALNLVKAVIMFICAFSWKEEAPLLTVGDAICSFLEHPDKSTENMCLLTRGYPKPMVRVFDGKRRLRWRVASNMRWIGVILLFATAIGVCIGLYRHGASHIKGGEDFNSLIYMGIGALDARTFVPSPITGTGPASLLQNVIVANAAQLIFSLIFFAYNSLVTTMALATEWNSFAACRKGLRLSGGTPVGAQRSTYRLQLPYRVALPLIAVSGTLHWLISQSIFLVYLEAYTPTTRYDGTEHSGPTTNGWPPDIITCGWSPPAVLAAVILGAVMLLLLVGFGLQRLPTAMPVAGSCSAAVAAACHPPAAGQQERIWEKEVMWGATLDPEGTKPGHCSFSSGTVTYPVRNGRYT